MPARRSQDAPPIQSKHFTLENIEHAIRKVKRWIGEVQAIDPSDTRFDHPQVEAATRNINADIGDIFGRNSLVRASVHDYNDESEVERFVRAVAG